MKLFADAGRGGQFSLVANMAVVVAVACTALAMLLDRATSGPDAPLVAMLGGKGGRITAPAGGNGIRSGLREAIVPQFDDLDATPTASIARGPIRLNPCLERQK